MKLYVNLTTLALSLTRSNTNITLLVGTWRVWRGKQTAVINSSGVREMWLVLSDALCYTLRHTHTRAITVFSVRLRMLLKTQCYPWLQKRGFTSHHIIIQTIGTVELFTQVVLQYTSVVSFLLLQLFTCCVCIFTFTYTMWHLHE